MGKCSTRSNEGVEDNRYRGHTSSRCFEIYGFDVLLDDCLKPWLLEVNIHPSLSATSPLDRRIKRHLVEDTLTLAGISSPGGHRQDSSSGSVVNTRLRKKTRDTRSQGVARQSMAQHFAWLNAMQP